MTTVNTSRGVPAAAAGTITLGGDLTVNRMGFGAMRLTGKGIWGPPKHPDQAVRVLQRAVELGVNFFDTADSYGLGERGRVLRARGPSLHPLVPALGRGAGQPHAARGSRETWGHGLSDRTRLAAGTLASDAGDPGDSVGGPPGGERGGRRDQAVQERHEGAGRPRPGRTGSIEHFE